MRHLAGFSIILLLPYVNYFAFCPHNYFTLEDHAQKKMLISTATDLSTIDRFLAVAGVVGGGAPPKARGVCQISKKLQ